MKGIVQKKLTACLLAAAMVVGMVPAASAASSDIVYEVDAGEEVAFDRSDFKEFFEDECDDTFRYVTFYPDSSYKSSNGVLYYAYDESGEESFSKSELEDYDFYYSKSSYGDYPLNKLSFVADEDAGDGKVTMEFRAWGEDDYVDGTLEIRISKASSKSGSKGDITYDVDAGDEVAFDRSDFKEFYEDECDDEFLYVTFYPDSSYKSSNGVLYYAYDESGEESFSKSELEDYDFYYSDSDYGDYPLKKVSFVADDDADGAVVTLEFTAHGEDDEAEGVLTIRIGEADEDSDSDADIVYKVDAGDEVAFDRSQFKEFYEDEYDDDFRYVTFYPGSSYKSSNGVLYYAYDDSDEESFSKSELEDYDFYYSSDDYGDYPLKKLSFVADDDADGATVTLEFRAWGDDDYVDGVLEIRIGSAGSDSTSGEVGGDIIYRITSGGSLQLNANDFARFMKKARSGSSLSYVRITDAPDAGILYYNFFGASAYGTSSERVTDSNCKNISLYFSPSRQSDYALSELTYIPTGSNYCDQIAFTAYSTDGYSASGTILISVTSKSISEIYGTTLSGTSVSFPAASLSIAVSGATGDSMDCIQLLALPASSKGTVYAGSGKKASTETLYSYSQINALQFTPASGFTGSVEIPYVAYGSSGKPVASGVFSIGVVSRVKSFTDVTASTWCYKYVTELSAAGVIDGYSDGSFQPNKAVTWGQALKLIMLAAGYDTQAPTGSSVFSGYLTAAKADGLVSGNVDLNAAITRQQMAQLAAKALELSISDLSSVNPFTDTSDPYVRAMNAAGIVEGYFSNGTSTFKPNNTLTRGQISAIVWRMQQYQA